MRADVCTAEDHDTQSALLAALAEVGASYDAADSIDSSECSLGVGLHRFRTGGGETITVFADAWGVDLEGPDAVVNRVLAILAGAA